MNSEEYRLIYLSLLADYEKTSRMILMIENSFNRSKKAGFDCLSDDFSVRLIYLKQHELDISVLIKKIYKLWKGGVLYDKKKDV